MFDPFMYLSLPLPSISMRLMTLTIIKSGSDLQISSFTITVPKDGKFEDLIRALSTACSLDADETLLVAEIYNNRIIHYLEEPADSLSLIRDGDQLVAYRLHKSAEEAPLVMFTHQQINEFCPGCKEHRQATKKLDLWRRPENFGHPPEEVLI